MENQVAKGQMQISDICLKYRFSLDARDIERGYTLLEILVVLVLVGLLTTLTLPQFSTILDRIDFSLKRESLEQELDGLAYKALKEGQPLVLFGQYPRHNDFRQAQTETIPSDELDLTSEVLEMYKPISPIMAADADVKIPQNWNLTVNKSIIYQTSGFCSGGTITLKVGETEYDYTLSAPTCHAQLVK
jgi:prepilin-type N-terminal cleavage/methylation domain-containing protein